MEKSMKQKSIILDFSNQLEGVADQLENVKWNDRGGFSAQCPAHDDDRNSLSVSEDNGKILMKCHAGCEFQEIIDCLSDSPHNEHRLSISNLVEHERELSFVRSEKQRPNFVQLLGRQPTQIYEYRTKEDRLSRFVVRMPDKRFIPVTPFEDQVGAVLWKPKAPRGLRSLYNLDELGAEPSKPALIVEGEKTADAAAELFPDHVVMTWQGGAQAVAKSDWTPLQGRDVKIWPDNDDAGKKAAHSIEAVLERTGCASCAIIEPPKGLPHKWDLADPIPEGVDIFAALNSAKASSNDLSRFLRTGQQLAKMTIPPREMVIDPFLSIPSINLIYATRGLGKTWFGLTMGTSIASGLSFLAYSVPCSRRVLYIDGEMPLADIQARIKATGGDKLDTFEVLSSELLFNEYHPLNINDERDRRTILRTLDFLKSKNRAPDVIFFDNLSSLRMGADENDNSELDPIIQFFIALRHKGYATCLIHHTGKNGKQRGASRLEDMMDTSIELKPSDGPSETAAFRMTFSKTRGERPKPDALDMRLVRNEDGILVWQFEGFAAPSAHDHTLLAIYKGPNDDYQSKFHSQNEVAEKRGMKKSAISKHVTTLRSMKFIEGQLDMTEKGKEHLKLVFRNLNLP